MVGKLYFCCLLDPKRSNSRERFLLSKIPVEVSEYLNQLSISEEILEKRYTFWGGDFGSEWGH